MTNFIAMQAKEFARAKHEGQKRKYNGEAYFNHLEEVAEIARTFVLGEEAEVLAYLHDTVEDTNTTHAELVEKFGVQIALGVRALSNEKSIANRKTRKAADRVRLADARDVVQSVKCADMISNARDIGMNDPNFAIVFLDEMDELIKVLRLAHKGLHEFANMVCQVEQLYLYLNKVKKDKLEKENVPSTEPTASTNVATPAGTPS